MAVLCLLRLELLPSSPGSGITSLKKRTLRSAFPGAWDKKFTGCRKSKPPSGTKRQQAAMCLPASIWSKEFSDTTRDLQLEVPFQEPGTGNSQEAGNANLLQGRRDSKLWCACQPLFEARRFLIQQETSCSAQHPKFHVREPWKSIFPCNPSTNIAGCEQYCQWGRKQLECVWHEWVPSWAQLFKGAFPLEVGPKSHWGRAIPSSFQPANGWNQAGSVRVRNRAVGWILMHLSIWTTWRPTREIQSPLGPKVRNTG